LCRHNHYSRRCCFLQTSKNDNQPNEAGIIVVIGAFGHLQVQPQSNVSRLFLALAGWAVFLSNALAFVVLPAFIFYMNRFQIEPEEKALARKFGQEFVAYKSRVRRWL
jgi:hypothetical protein